MVNLRCAVWNRRTDRYDEPPIWRNTLTYRQTHMTNLRCAVWKRRTDWQTWRTSDVPFENKRTDIQACRTSDVPFKTGGQTGRHNEPQMCRFKQTDRQTDIANLRYAIWYRRTDRHAEPQMCLLKQTDIQSCRTTDISFQTEWQTDRHAERQISRMNERDGRTARQTDRHTEPQIFHSKQTDIEAGIPKLQCAFWNIQTKQTDIPIIRCAVYIQKLLTVKQQPILTAHFFLWFSTFNFF